MIAILGGLFLAYEIWKKWNFSSFLHLNDIYQTKNDLKAQSFLYGVKMSKKLGIIDHLNLTLESTKNLK